MKRKVSRIGPSTLMVSLPSKWVKKYGVMKGDEIDVDSKNNSIVLRTKAIAEERKTKVELSNLTESLIINKILSAYIKGFDEIQLYFTNTVTKKEKNEIEVMKIIEGMVDLLIGVEVIEQKTNSCTIKDLSGTSIEELKKILQRTFSLLENMGNECYVGLKDNKKQLLHNLIYTKRHVRKFLYFSYRSLSKIEYKDYQSSLILNNMLSHFETICEVYRIIGKENTKIKNSTESVSFLNKVNKLFLQLKKIYFTYNEKEIMQLKIEIKILYKSINEFYETSRNTKDILFVSRLTVIINSIDQTTKLLVFLQ